MDLKSIVAISKLPGLYKIKAQRPDGLIVSPLDQEISSFVSNRTHIFTPLESITLYTLDDNIELTHVFSEMKKNEDAQPVVDSKASSDALRNYMRSVLPDYDEERVYVSDIKKLIKWYNQLNDNDLVSVISEEKNNEESEDTASDEQPEDTSASEEAEDAEETTDQDEKSE